MASSPLRIGTRGSPLALIQADEVRRRLIAAGSAPDALEIVPIRTTGDAVRDRALSELGGKGLFTKEIEDALLDKRIDIAVHSMKDVPTWLPAGLAITAVLPREDPRDVLMVATRHGPARSIAGLPAERAMLGVLDGWCRTPIGGLAVRDGDRLVLDGLVAMPDGSALHRRRQDGPASDPVALGLAVGQALREAAGPDFFKGAA